MDLEAALRGVRVDAVGETVERFFAGARAEILSVTPDDVMAALQAALAPEARASAPAGPTNAP